MSASVPTISCGPKREVSRQEWTWVVIVAALIVTASTLPYLAGYLAQTPQRCFSGAVLDKADYHSHLAKMWQGYRGNWRYHLLFTSESHKGAYMQTFYVALGHIARVTRIRLPTLYQIARVGLGFFMLLSVYRFIAHFVPSVSVRRTAFLLATIASGLGWIREIIAPTAPGGVSPMSFWLLDGYIYLSLLTFPHFCMAITLLLTIFLLLLGDPKGPSVKVGLLATLLSLVLGLIHPYMLLVVDLVPALYWLTGKFETRQRWRGLLAVAGMGVLQSPLLGYDFWVFRSQPVFAAWSSQNVTLSPPPGVYLWGYGLLLTLGSFGVLAHSQRARQTKPSFGRGRKNLTFLLLWIGLVMVLIHLPWNLQRRFLEGVQVPLGILAAIGLGHLKGRMASVRVGKQLQASVVGLAAVGHLYMTAGLALGATNRQPSLYWSQDVLAAVDWLGDHTTWEQTVLAAPETGSLIPAHIGHRVVVGHKMETVDYDNKLAAISDFYDMETSNAVRAALLENWGVSYVFYGPHERALGGFSPKQTDSLTRVFSRDGVFVYEVRP